ncbi:MAG: OmpH family outer membrane protein [Candidatus Eremiobacteraeota bacterium]|nr:OmpH family outer membrane protein [Candidatus Eremiobacteraeota bacterium]MBV9263571.1 OmpH family outer membrane protein [Candidatus Eremiobacteraeota bacterium]
MKRHRPILLLCLAAIAAGCAPHSPIGLVDVQRIVVNWPEYQGYQNQMLRDERSISSRRESTARKAREAVDLQRKYSQITDRLSAEIRSAAGQVAAQRQLKLVLTREGIGYGGVDITRDVEKALNITEKSSPTPGT